MHEALPGGNPPSAAASRVRGGRLAVAAVLVLAGLACLPVLANGFAYDDAKVVQAVSDAGRPNPMVHELRPIADYFTTEYWTGAGVETRHTNPLYRPVTVWSFAVTHAALPGAGSLLAEAWPHHLLNLLLHLLNTLLVFVVVRRLIGRAGPGPVVAAAVFGLAAIHAEPIAAVVGRADLLAFGFGMAAWWLLLGAAAGDRPAVRRAGAGLLLFLAFCSKESALAWWPFLVCAAWVAGWSGGRFDRRGVAWALAVGALPALVWLLLRAQAFAGLAAAHPVAYVSNPLRDLELPTRILAALFVWGYSLLKMLVPYPLVSDYGAAVFDFASPAGRITLLESLYLVPWLAAVLGLWFTARPRTRQPLLFLGLAGLLGFGFVTSNIPVVIGTLWAERLAYLPSLGLALVAAWWFGGRPRGRPAAALLAVYLVCSAVVLFVRIGDWRDDYTLFHGDVRRQPRSLNLRLQAAVQELRRNRLAAWREHLEAAVAVEPEFARGYIELAAGLFQFGGGRDPKVLAECEVLLRRALDARILEPSEEPMLWRNFAVLMLSQGRETEALNWFQRMLDRDPAAVMTRHLVLVDAARAFSDQVFLRILVAGERAVPGHPVWGLHRGLRAARRGDGALALRHLEAALPRLEFLDATVQQAWLALANQRQAAGDDAGARSLLARIAADPRFAPSIRQAAARAR